LLLPGKAYRADLEANMSYMLLVLSSADADAIELLKGNNKVQKVASPKQLANLSAERVLLTSLMITQLQIR
jgi:hypothetical protein